MMQAPVMVYILRGGGGSLAISYNGFPITNLFSTMFFISRCTNMSSV